MEHKAFIFDYESFEQELRMTLEVALATGDCDALLSFIRNNKESLSDPYEGEPLDNDWKRMIEIEDAHQYGDFALTRYYSPQEVVGLGSSWKVAQELLAILGEMPISPILGSTIGPTSEPFDPGKSGSYFQTAEQVQESLASLKMLRKMHPSEELSEAVDLLEDAANSRKGLYVTF